MEFRLQIGKFLFKISAAVKALVPLVLTSKDIMEANRKFSASSSEIEFWSSSKWIKKGLNEIEKNFLEKYKIKSGRLLVLGCGGGREAIALAKLGFEVVGVDFTAEILNKARKLAVAEKVKVAFQRQDISRLSLKESSFDYAILSSFLYSSIPIRRIRIGMLKNVRKILRPKGKFLLTLNFSRPPKNRRLRYTIKKIIALLTLGNIHCQDGDSAIQGDDFFCVLHNFYEPKELLEEINEAGLEAEEVNSKLEYAVLSS